MCKLGRQLRLSILSGILTALTSLPAFANPQGGNVVHGQAQFRHSGNGVFNVDTMTNRTIINWQSFNIGQNELTRFNQPSAGSAVLNRVTGHDPSQLLGQLRSNGRVFLINRNGIVFGNNAIIDTAGFVASTLNITDQNFIDNHLNFSGEGSQSIVNKGLITAGPGGEVVLIAPQIENHGVLTVDNGQLLLAAGEDITISSLNYQDIEFTVQAPEHQVLNLGALIAERGSVGVFAGSIQHEGVIEANSIGFDADGNIVLQAQQELSVAATASVSADGNRGGDITLQNTGGDTVVRGSVSAVGLEKEGGDIKVLGERVGIFGDALLDASGQTGGGRVLVGGDFQGKGDIQTATQTQLDSDVAIHVDAITSGDGGTAIVWADGYTLAQGTVTARGGAESGDGGFVEVSGKDSLVFRGTIDTSADYGNAGTVLFDPQDITIDNSAVPINTANDQFAESPGVSATFGVNGAGGLNALLAGNVVLQANNDVFMGAAGINGGGGNLTIQAGRTINITAGPTNFLMNGGDLTLIANSTLADGVVDGNRAAGAANILIGDGGMSANIDTGGGNLVLEIRDGAGLTNNTAGAIVINDLVGLNSGGGDITFRADTSFTILGGGVSINAGAGGVFLEPYSAGTNIGIEGGAGTLLFNDLDLDFLTADSLTIGSANTGVISIGGSLAGTPYNNLTLLANGDIVRENFAPDFNMDSFGPGDTLTLRSLNGNIRFVDNTQVIETDGAGDIVLDAPNGSLLNLGRVSNTTPGGNISLLANGNIELNDLISSGFGAGSITIDSATGQIIQAAGNIFTGNLTLNAATGFDVATSTTSLAFDNSGDGFVQIINNSAGLSLNASNNNATSFSTIIQEQTGPLSIDGNLTFAAPTFGTNITANGGVTNNANINGSGGGILLGSGGTTVSVTNNGLISDTGGIVLVATSAGETVVNNGILDNAGGLNDIVLEADNITLGGGSINTGNMAKTILNRSTVGTWDLPTAFSSAELNTIQNEIAIGNLVSTNITGVTISGPINLTNGQDFTIALDMGSPTTIDFVHSVGNGISGTGLVRLMADSIDNQFAGTLDVQTSGLFETLTNNGVGASFALDTQVAQFTATNNVGGSGSISISNSGIPLEIVAPGVRNEVMGGGANIDIVNAGGAITVNGLVFTEDGNIIIDNSLGTDINVNTDVFVNAGTGFITLNAGQDLNILPSNIGPPETVVDSQFGNVNAIAGNDIRLIAGNAASRSTRVSAGNVLTLNAGNDIILQGGGANDARASLTGLGGVNVTSGGDLTVTGGSGPNTEASINGDGTITIDAGANMTIAGGSGVSSGAVISNETIAGVNILVDVAGDLSLLGGSGVDAPAAIGTSDAAINVVIGNIGNIGGDVIMTAGTGGSAGGPAGSSAAIGAVQGGSATSITMSIDGSLVMQSNNTNGEVAMIGSEIGAAGQNVQIDVGLGGGGDMNINNGLIKTFDNLTLGTMAGGGFAGNIVLNQGVLDVGALNFNAAGDFNVTDGIINLDHTALTSTFSSRFQMNGGVMNIDAALDINNVFNNRSTITWQSGAIGGSGVFNNLNTGLFEINTASTFNPQMVNTGFVIKQFNTGVTTFNNGYIQNAGSAANPALTALVGGNAELNIAGQMDLNRGFLLGDGTITTPTLRVGDALIAPGSLVGPLAPPSEVQIGTLTINGDLVMSPDSILTVDLVGNNQQFVGPGGVIQTGGPGISYDLFEVTGNATLDGVFHMGLALNLYRGMLDDQFMPLSFGSTSGQFAEVTATNGYQFLPELVGGELVFTLIDTPFVDGLARFLSEDELAALQEQSDNQRRKMTEEFEEEKRKRLQARKDEEKASEGGDKQTVGVCT